MTCRRSRDVKLKKKKKLRLHLHYDVTAHPRSLGSISMATTTGPCDAHAQTILSPTESLEEKAVGRDVVE